MENPDTTQNPEHFNFVVVGGGQAWPPDTICPAPAVAS